ncbi:hypothetical protein LRH25_26610 [Ideonella azotifigens]|uniref:4Fe-4S ferredoxin-type domain-containing protein n=1 Tax=Ideonella azotifigens TaxID=513160 RepID=A0ABP3VB24_9BURK|nr:hypothetical protein [Ideonella azotifigens]MCD2343900.1 hypothetical protein [Ideonella azotifigens]
MVHPPPAAPFVQRVIRLQLEAPPKPAVGQACNGCGVCCAWAPCPLGMLVSGKRQGACLALQWQADAGLYRCGMVAAPRQVLHWLPEPAAKLLSRLARRWISAASGCDADLAVSAT